MRFSELTRVTRIDTDTFEVDIEPAAFIVRGPNGGYLAALLLRSLVERVDDANRAPRSLTVHYPAAPVAGPATITTEVIRAGRSSERRSSSSIGSTLDWKTPSAVATLRSVASRGRTPLTAVATA